MPSPSLSRLIPFAATLLLSACSSEPTNPVDAGGIDFNRKPLNSWQLLAPKGSGPVNLNAVAYAPNLQAIFGATMNDNEVGHLWRFDLRHDTWTELPTTNWPIGKYRTLTYDPGGRRLLTYWNGVGQVYAIPDAGGSWAPVGSAPNQDDSYEGYVFLNPVDRRLTTFAGYGFGAWNDILREWNETSSQWVTLSQSDPHPSPRFGGGPSAAAVDPGNHRVFLGQRSLGLAEGGYDDLWQLDLQGNVWRNLIPASNDASALINSALAWSDEFQRLYRFGGCGPVSGSICTVYSNQLLMARPDAQPVTWSPVAAGGVLPSGRAGMGFFYDAPRNRLILVSGGNRDTAFDDVWAFKIRD